MQSDLWQQWQSFAAQFAPPGFAAQTRPGASPRDWTGGAPAMNPWMDAAERFTSEARAFLGNIASASSAATTEAARKFGDFLREQFAGAERWGFGLGAAAPAPAMEAPALGAAREHQQRALRMADAARRAEEAQRRLHRLWSDALREAATVFVARIAPDHASPASAESLRKLYDTWIDCAEDAYARTAHGEPFANALADLMNASSQWRHELQANIEHWAKLFDLPTRSEVNTLIERLRAVEERLNTAQTRRAAVPEGAVDDRQNAAHARRAAQTRRTAVPEDPVEERLNTAQTRHAGHAGHAGAPEDAAARGDRAAPEARHAAARPKTTGNAAGRRRGGAAPPAGARRKAKR